VSASPAIDAAPFIKDIGRGRDNPTDLDFERARTLWRAVLGQQLDPVALGGVLIAMRVKGESVVEMGGFLEACDDGMLRLDAPAGQPVPVVIPSYNGARKLANLTPLLALLLASKRVPVLVHGSSGGRDIPAGRARRVTSAEIFAALGIDASRSADDVYARWSSFAPAFVDIADLHPALDRVLQMRRILGVRNSAHSLCKLLQPVNSRALCLSSFTHPEYHAMLEALYALPAISATRDVLLLRATEGEAVCNARRASAMQWYRDGISEALEPDDSGPMLTPEGLPQSFGVAETATYIEAVLAGRLDVPGPIAWQVESIMRARAARLRAIELSSR